MIQNDIEMPSKGNHVTRYWREVASSSRCLIHMSIRMMIVKSMYFDRDNNWPNGRPSHSFNKRQRRDAHAPAASKMKHPKKQHRTGKEETRTHNPRRSIPKYNRDRQRHNIPDPPRKIKQQEKIPHKATRQTGPIQTQAPFRIFEPDRFFVHIGKLWIIILSPGSHQGGDRKDIGEGPDSSGEEGNSGAAEPPVGREIVGVGAHVDAPFWFLVGGDREAAGGGATLGRDGRRVFGGFGIAAAAGRGDGVGGGGGGGGHGVSVVLFIYLYSGWLCTMGLARRDKQAFRANRRL